MKRLLERISWLTHRWSFKFKIFELYLHDERETWGFEFFTIEHNYRVYSALAFLFRLPNKTNVREFTIDDWDFLFLERSAWKLWERLDDRRTWGGKLTRFESFLLNLLDKIVK